MGEKAQPGEGLAQLSDERELEALSGADADHIGDFEDEDTAVVAPVFAALVWGSDAGDQIDHVIHTVGGDEDLHLHPGDVGLIFTAAIAGFDGVAAAGEKYFGDDDVIAAQRFEGGLDVVQQEWVDEGLDFHHDDYYRPLLNVRRAGVKKS